MESICKGTFFKTPGGREVSWGCKLAIAIAVVAGSALSGIMATFDARAAAGPTVGMVTKVENQAQIGTETAVVGTLVHMNDALQTGAKAHLQVTFRDKTELTLGENASVVIDRYVFDPDAGIGEAALNATKGAFRLATGKLSEMRKKDINVSTPFAALAVRGTDFWWGPIDGQFGVLLVSNSKLDVRKERCAEGTDSDRRKCRCAVTLDKAGEGTDIDRGKCPGAPYQWPPEKVTFALSTTSFSVALLGPSLAVPAAAAAAAAGAFAASAAANHDHLPPLPPPRPHSP